MSNTSIFDQLNSEAPAGSKYEDLISFEIPPFVWTSVNMVKGELAAPETSPKVVTPIAVMSLTKRAAA